MSLDSLIAGLNKKRKDQIFTVGIPNIKYPRIPFSSPRANYMLYGGLPRKRMIECFGDYSSGKTTTALDVVANEQKIIASGGEAGRVVYVDTENTMDYDWAKSIGVDVDTLVLMQPHYESAEQILQMVLDIIEDGEVRLIVLDSIANMVSQQARDKDLTEKTMAGISAALTMFCQKGVPMLSNYNCTFLGINQVRADLNNPYSLYSTPGGQSWKLNCSVRIQFKHGAQVDDTGAVVTTTEEKNTADGNQVQMNIKKSKICKNNRLSGFYTLNYNRGVDKYCDLFDLLKDNGLDRKSVV